MRTGERCPDGCGRVSGEGGDGTCPVPVVRRHAAADWTIINCLRAQLARVTAESADHEAHWRAAEMQIAHTMEPGNLACETPDPKYPQEWCGVRRAAWSPRAKGYRCADCEKAGR